MKRSILERMADATVVALSLDGGEWPRTLTSATLVPDRWMGLVERSDGARRFVPAGEDPRPNRDDRLLLVRNRPITVPIDVEDTRAACGHAVRGGCEVLVRWPARDDDLAALGRTLPEAGELSLGELARLVADNGGRVALQQLIRARPATTLVREDLSDVLLAALREQLARLLFASGLTLERLATLKLTSPSLAAEEALQQETAARIERIQARTLVEQAAQVATRRRLEGLTTIFEKLKAAAANDPQVQWHDLLPALSPAERGRLLENLWRITPDQRVAEAIAVVAGRECLWLDPAAPDRFFRRVPLAEELGGLRSVEYCPERRWLVVGAARGLWAVDAADGRVLQRYAVPDAGQPRTGFNAAALVGSRLVATHSQLGVWSWSVDSPGDARPWLEPRQGLPGAVRAVTALPDGRIMLAADDTVRVFDATGAEVDFPGQLPRTIHCLAALDRWLYAGLEDGTLYGFELGGPDVWVRLHRSATLFESIQARRWGDLVELIIPAGVDGVCGVYPDESVVSRLMPASTPIRRAWASDDALVALNENRDRLVVLHASRPERAGQEVALARMLGSSIQDACIVSRHEGTEARSHEGEDRCLAGGEHRPPGGPSGGGGRNPGNEPGRVA